MADETARQLDYELARLIARRIAFDEVSFPSRDVIKAWTEELEIPHHILFTVFSTLARSQNKIPPPEKRPVTTIHNVENQENPIDVWPLMWSASWSEATCLLTVSFQYATHSLVEAVIYSLKPSSFIKLGAELKISGGDQTYQVVPFLGNHRRNDIYHWMVSPALPTNWFELTWTLSPAEPVEFFPEPPRNRSIIAIDVPKRFHPRDLA
ncbi:MAG: hypothetical protein C7B47_09630 [Sulfobacillus thermosulfidooxidans]|uniref:Uncharacterized protein n=1 Tax=Sulfobacillus thermosulfidooxidans TaxID=28034 RepID=A0A2T2WX91_SULTH|nr:MAG: hypothetical protein C7B47_09630 [Sulfobacillus thermosulfidooxidans]